MATESACSKVETSHLLGQVTKFITVDKHLFLHSTVLHRAKAKHCCIGLHWDIAMPCYTLPRRVTVASFRDGAGRVCFNIMRHKEAAYCTMIDHHDAAQWQVFAFYDKCTESICFDSLYSQARLEVKVIKHVDPRYSAPVCDFQCTMLNKLTDIYAFVCDERVIFIFTGWIIWFSRTLASLLKQMFIKITNRYDKIGIFSVNSRWRINFRPIVYLLPSSLL